MATSPAALQSQTTPEFTLDGRVNAALARDLTLLSIDDDIDGLRRMVATFIAVGPREGERDEQLNWLDGSVLDFGKQIDVALGPSDARETVFSGRISALELSMEQGRAAEVVCFAEDRLMDLRMTRRFKSYEDASDADIVNQIAAEHGLSAQVDVDGPTWQLVQQWNQSDLAFLRERARRLAAEIWLEGDALHMATRDRRGGQPVTLIQGGNLMQVRVRADLAHQRSRQVVGGFDDGDEDAIDGAAGSSDIEAEAQGHSHGGQVLERAFGERVSHRVRDVPLRDAQATALARAALLARARRFVCVSGVADGNLAIRVGCQLRLERVSPLFEGDGFHVTRVRHQFDLDSGFRSHFDAERSWIGSS